MNYQIDFCPLCDNQGFLNFTNTINSRIHLLTIGNHGKFISRICNKCLNKIDDDFANGIFPELQGLGFKVLVFGLPVYLYEIYEQYPKIKEQLSKALRFINNIYKGFVKIPTGLKLIYDFAALINILDKGCLKVEKIEILKFLQLKYPKIINKIHEKSEEILNWNVKMKFPILIS